MSAEPQVCLNCTVDGQPLKISVEAAKRIGIIRPLLEMSLKANTPEITLPVNEVRGPLMAKIVEYLEAHKKDPIRREVGRKNPETNTTNATVNTEASEAESGDETDEEDIEPIDQYENDDFYYERYAEVISPWDQKFMEAFDIPTLIELTKAANYLYIADLLDLCCKTIAGEMVGLSVEELRLKFNIKNDFTPEEEARLAAEFAWAEES